MNTAYFESPKRKLKRFKTEGGHFESAATAGHQNKLLQAAPLTGLESKQMASYAASGFGQQDGYGSYSQHDGYGSYRLGVDPNFGIIKDI